MNLRRFGIAAVVFLAAAGWYFGQPPQSRPALIAPSPGPHPPDPSPVEGVARQQLAGDAVRAAFQARSSGIEIETEGEIVRLLADDRDGSPHQKFIVRTPGGATVLVAHNIDLAPRLDGLSVGDHVAILGEYEWNEHGGVLHWTHRDPAGHHQTGHIDWDGRRYQ